MSGQALGAYERPFLEADRIEAPADGTLRLTRSGHALDLTVGGDAAAARALLEQMRDPAWPGWSELRHPADGGLGELVDALEHQGWLNDAGGGGRAVADRERERLAGAEDEAVAWLAEADRAYRSAAARHGGAPDRFRATLARAARQAAAIAGTPGVIPETVGADIAGTALPLLLAAWQRTSRLALALTARAFARADAGFVGRPAGATALAGDALSDVAAARRQLWTACMLVLSSALDREPARHAAFLPAAVAGGSGIVALVEAERCLEKLFAAAGPSPLLHLIGEGRRARPAAAGVHLHQHFITIHYIEAVLSFLRHRLRPAMREVGFRYLFEEVGHESHERAACLRLGLSDADVDGFAPLPLFAAYPDILVHLAESDPLAFCYCIVVAEGLPGTRKPIVSALSSAGFTDPEFAEHAEIDVVLDHATFTRRLMRHVPHVTPEAQAAALRRLLFVAELSHRAWADLARYAADETLPAAPGPFALSPESVIALSPP